MFKNLVFDNGQMGVIARIRSWPIYCTDPSCTGAARLLTSLTPEPHNQWLLKSILSLDIIKTNHTLLRLKLPKLSMKSTNMLVNNITPCVYKYLLR